MHNKIFIVSRYQGLSQNFHKFHFIGYFKGQKITKILVRGGDYMQNEDYVLALKDVKCQQTTLYGKVVKSKKLF